MTSSGLFLVALSGGGPTAILFQERPGVGVPILFMPDYSDILPMFIHEHLPLNIFKYIGRFILLITIPLAISIFKNEKIKYTRKLFHWWVLSE